MKIIYSQKSAVFMEGQDFAEKDLMNNKLDYWCRRKSIRGTEDETSCSRKPCNSAKCVEKALDFGSEPGNISCVAIDNNPEKFEYLRKSDRYREFCPQKKEPKKQDFKHKNYTRPVEEDHDDFGKYMDDFYKKQPVSFNP